MNLYIANASSRLSAQKDRINAAYKRAITTMSGLFHLDCVDVICLPDTKMIIPEIGIGGYTPNRHLTYLYIDPDFDVSEDEIYNTLCHELYHAKRYEGEGYGKTLFDSMIFEGLAVAFEEELSGKDAFMPAQLLSRTGTALLLQKVNSDLYTESFDHFKWFIVDSANELPRWAGYELGYYLVREYIAKSNKKASELVLEASSTFMKV